jgi:hypothetical protein
LISYELDVVFDKSGGNKGKWAVCGHFLNVGGDFLNVSGDFLNGPVNGFVLSSRFFALRAVVGSSGPEAGVPSTSVSVGVLAASADRVNRAAMTIQIRTLPGPLARRH